MNWVLPQLYVSSKVFLFGWFCVFVLGFFLMQVSRNVILLSSEMLLDLKKKHAEFRTTIYD